MADLSARFDALTATAVVLLDIYNEGGLSIVTAGRSWAADTTMAPSLDPFHGAGTDRGFYALSSPISDWITIRTTGSAVMFGVEFLYGNTWTNGDLLLPWGNSQAVVDWQTWKNGSIVSSGNIGPEPALPVGTTVGFYDADGFDELVVRATLPTSGDPSLQALALDSVAVMLVDRPPVPVVTISTSGPIPSLVVPATVPGREYRLLFSNSAVTPVWEIMPVQGPGGWIPGGGQLMFADFAAPGVSARFYRVEAR